MFIDDPSHILVLLPAAIGRALVVMLLLPLDLGCQLVFEILLSLELDSNPSDLLLLLFVELLLEILVVLFGLGAVFIFSDELVVAGVVDIVSVGARKRVQS